MELVDAVENNEQRLLAGNLGIQTAKLLVGLFVARSLRLGLWRQVVKVADLVAQPGGYGAVVALKSAVAHKVVDRLTSDVAAVLLKPVGKQSAFAHAARARQDEVAVIARHEAVKCGVSLVIADVGRQTAAQKGPLAAALTHKLRLRLVGEV